MGKVESTIRGEVVRLARREVRSAFLPLRRDVRGLKVKISSLSKNLVVLNRLAKEQVRQTQSHKLNLEASPEEVKASRFTPHRIRGLREKLGLSQKELATLTGVSLGAVGLWEKGKFTPKTDKKAALLALRKMGKRNVRNLLSQKAQRTEREAPRKPRSRGAARRRRSPKK